jgi:predicted Zn-dependent protease with MMP-like domain
VVRPPSVRRAARDRRSRGLRGAPWTSGPARASTASGLAPGAYGPLAPPDSPLALTRSERFTDLVGDAVQRLEARWERELENVEFVVAPVPPAPDPLSTDPAPLARLYPGGAGGPAYIALYRRPIEARASNRLDLSALVHDVVVELVAELLGLEPETIDPDYGRGEP